MGCIPERYPVHLSVSDKDVLIKRLIVLWLQNEHISLGGSQNFIVIERGKFRVEVKNRHAVTILSVQILVCFLSSSVTLGKFLHLSRLLFPHLENEDNQDDYFTDCGEFLMS